MSRPVLTVVQGGRDPAVIVARKRLRLKLGREPTEEETLEEMLKAALAEMFQRWTATGRPSAARSTRDL